ncbi:MAG: translocation/assembly module TamB domain-containing protein, partial [candidate division WOR-3 bacterium]
QVGLSGARNFKDVSGRVAVGGEGVKLAGQDWDAAQFVWTGPEFDLRIEKEAMRLTAQGDIAFNPESIGCVVRKLEFITERETAAIADSCQLNWQDGTLMVKGVKAQIADGELKLDLTTRRGEPLELIGSVRGLNLSKFQQLVGSIIRTKDRGPGTEVLGSVDFDVFGKDTLFLNFIGRNFALPASNINLKYLTGKMALFREGAFIREVKFVHQEDTSSISGLIQWSTKERLAITKANLNLSLANPGAWIFAVTRPYVEINEGSIYGNLSVNWQPDHLDFSGRARVSNGLLIVPSVTTTVQDVQAELTLNKEKIVLEKLSGKSSKGTVTAEGFLKLTSGFECESLHYETRFFGVSAAPISGVYAIGDGVIKILWAKGMERVLISGRADIAEALLTFGFGGGGGGSGGSSSEGVDYDIRVRGERGIWLRNRDCDIELGADLTFRQVGNEAVYTGELLVRQGSIYYLDHILKVTKGRLVFDNVSQFTPQLDITAELPVAHSKKSAPEKIVLRLTGNLSQPIFTLSSEPPLWDETQILSYLSLNVTMEEISALEQKELLNRLLSERLLGYFQTQVAKRMREFISLDYLEIESGVLTGQGARVTVGKYVGRNLYVSYTQNFTGELQPGFLVEYYLNRRNELLAERSFDGRYALRYRFKIRY